MYYIPSDNNAAAGTLIIHADAIVTKALRRTSFSFCKCFNSSGSFKARRLLKSTYSRYKPIPNMPPTAICV